MKLVLSSICVSSLLLASFSFIQRTTAQCLTNNDDVSKGPSSMDLSGILDFNLQLFRELVPSDVKRNFIFSPYSIWNALTLAYFGASGRTEEQLRKVLRLDDKLSTLKKWRALEYMYNRRPETSSNNIFINANRAYFDARITLRSCIEDILHNEVEKIDFTKPQKASDHINNFVSQTTKGTIKELVSPADVDRARFALVNAAYFKGVWEKTFSKDETRPTSFTGLDDTQYTVDMMHQQGKFKFGYDDQIEATALELPYSGQTISMVLFLPYDNTQRSFNNMIQGLSKRKFEEIINKMAPTEIVVQIPKFKLDTTVGDELLQTLATMGLTDSFDRSKADFTTFTLARQINLDKSIQKAFIDVNEEGTEAGAATAFIGTKSGSLSSFVCNRPFVFVIRDNDTKNLLFMGVFKSSNKANQSHKPSRTPDRSSLLPEQDKINKNVNLNKNPKPIIPFEGGSTNGFSHDQFPTHSPDHNIPSTGQNSVSTQSSNRNIPSFGGNSKFIPGQNIDRNIASTRVNSGSIPVRGSHQTIGQNIPSSGGNSGSIPNRGSSQSIDQNIPYSGGNSASIPGIGSYQNIDQNIPSSGGNSGSIPGRGSFHNIDVNNPLSGGNSGSIPGRGPFQNIGQNIPLSGGNSGSIPGRGPFQNIDQNIPSSGGNSGSIPGRGPFQNINPSFPYSGGNSGSIPGSGSFQNINQNIPFPGFPHNSNHNIPTFGGNNFIPGRDSAASHHNIPSFAGNNAFLSNIPGRGVIKSPDRNIPSFGGNNEFISDRGVIQSSNQNVPPFGINSGQIHDRLVTPSSTQNIHSFGGNGDSFSGGGAIQRPEQNIPFFGVNNGFNNGGGAIPNSNRNVPSFGINQNIPSFGGNSELFPVRTGIQSSVHNVPPLNENREFFSGGGVVQQPNRNIPSFDRNTENIYNREVSQSSNRYAAFLETEDGQIIPSILILKNGRFVPNGSPK